jgi:hypothetical protein
MNTPLLVPPGIFEHALKEAKIVKTASIHSLRNSAVHLIAEPIIAMFRNFWDMPLFIQPDILM